MAPETTVKLIAAVLLLVVLAILFLRRKGKKPKTEDEDF
jgi:LPXTG-motif cell wall-anchored protein